MTNKKEWILWILYGAVLILLFLMTSTDLIIKEKAAEVYPISVIIEDTSDDYYVNFRRGVERAAMELNADVSFITLYEQGNRVQQMDMMMREQEEEGRGLIISPVDEAAAAELQASKRINTPLVLLNAEEDLVKEESAASVTFDFYGLGEELAGRIMREQPASQPVYLFGCRGHALVDGRLSEGLRSVLEPAGYELREYTLQQVENLEQVLGRLSGVAGGGAAVVALDPESLTTAAQLLEDGRDSASWIRGLYGRGNTVPILNYLDKGVIQATCITDDFSAGYVSVEAAVEQIQGRPSGSREYLDGSCIGREELRTGKYEKMLYPIE